MADFILEKALKQFSLETEHLELTYRSLEIQFNSLQNSLQDTQTRLYGKLGELDFTSAYLDAILSHISQGILFIDLNGIVTTYNKTAEEILGISSSNILLQTFWETIPDTALGFSLKQALESKICPKNLSTSWQRESKKLELEIETTFIGMNVPFSARPASTLKSSQNTIQGLLVLVRNITELRQLQIVANRNERLKEVGEMAARVAHEIRNPLGGIKGFASLLQQDLQDRPELQEMASQIEQGTDALSSLVSNILNYTRPLQLHLESTDLIPFMYDMLQLVQADTSISPKTICQMETNLTSLLVPIDTQQFKAAILNILVNAIQAMPEGGRLIVGIQESEEHAIIRIQDTGVGISEENLDKIFSPFFTTKKEGNGLGLSEVHKMIQAHGGLINVQSEVGKGSVFTIKIPLKIT